MRGATQFARRVKQLLRTLRTKYGKVQRPAVGDPVTQLILGVLTRDALEARAREALERLREMVVDYNELRVVSPLELCDALGDFPDARRKSEDISRALNRIFAVEHIVSLDGLSEMSQRDGRAYLDRIDGLEPYSKARIRLLGLGQIAVPLDEAMLAFVRRERVVDPAASHEEIQAFLERQFDLAEALEFFVLLRKHAWHEMSSTVRKGKAEKILSVPPDRTSRNMLQLITPGSLKQAQAAADASSERAAARSSARSRPAAAKPDSKPAPKPETRPAGKRPSRAAPAAQSAAATASPPSPAAAPAAKTPTKRTAQRPKRPTRSAARPPRSRAR
ncbi:MAG: hypothetical protein HRU75_11895 [Planctomycetia bacterium]|nr:MAG: hypothetical protein HRU75_11895 [Planctomycetia bacterium]